MNTSQISQFLKRLVIHIEKHPAHLLLFIVGLSILVATYFIYAPNKDDADNGKTIEYFTEDATQDGQAGKRLACKVSYVERTVEGDSMEPFIKNGEKMVLLEKFYKECNEKPKIGDIVAYAYGGNRHPLIKAVRATSADTVEILDATIKINGQFLRNSAGEAYKFTPGEVQLMNLYVRNGHIPNGSYLVFGDNVNNSVDSRKFWAVSSDDFLGKFIRQ